MKKRKINKLEMARRMRTSRAALDRLLAPGNASVALETLGRAARAVGRDLHIELRVIGCAIQRVPLLQKVTVLLARCMGIGGLNGGPANPVGDFVRRKRSGRSDQRPETPTAARDRNRDKTSCTE